VFLRHAVVIGVVVAAVVVAGNNQQILTVILATTAILQTATPSPGMVILVDCLPSSYCCFLLQNLGP
jgi:hypothetical protein